MKEEQSIKEIKRKTKKKGTIKSPFFLLTKAITHYEGQITTIISILFLFLFVN
jgi:hypothetical protein